MTNAAMFYQPKQSWRTAVAFGVALLIHAAAIAIANVQQAEKTALAPFTHEFTPLTLEEPPARMDPPPDNPEALPPPARGDNSFSEENPTPPPIRRQPNKPLTPIVKRTSSGIASPRPWSSAKALALHSQRPEYPYEARRQKITGDGIVAMAVDPTSGHVSRVSMLKSTGNPFLDNAALSAFRRWRFKPGTVTSVTCPVTFTLTGASY
jgi:protein TonB